MNFNTYWETQTYSRHRFDSVSFYNKKAKEQCFILGSNASKEIVDIGCGAGELLSSLIHCCNIKEAIDYSDSMLNIARDKLQHTDINFISKDTFSYLKDCHLTVWQACASINQYSTPKEQQKLIDIFIENKSVKSMYLFDTICPARYFLRSKANILDFNSTRKTSYLRGVYGFFHGIIHSIFNPSSLEYRSIGKMGYAYAPSFFRRIAEEKGLKVEIVNSLYYEYRYHIVIKKYE